MPGKYLRISDNAILYNSSTTSGMNAFVRPIQRLKKPPILEVNRLADIVGFTFDAWEGIKENVNPNEILPNMFCVVQSFRDLRVADVSDYRFDLGVDGKVVCEISLASRCSSHNACWQLYQAARQRCTSDNNGRYPDGTKNFVGTCGGAWNASHRCRSTKRDDHAADGRRRHFSRGLSTFESGFDCTAPISQKTNQKAGLSNLRLLNLGLVIERRIVSSSWRDTTAQHSHNVSSCTTNWLNDYTR